MSNWQSLGSKFYFLKIYHLFLKNQITSPVYFFGKESLKCKLNCLAHSVVSHGHRSSAASRPPRYHSPYSSHWQQSPSTWRTQHLSEVIFISAIGAPLTIEFTSEGEKNAASSYLEYLVYNLLKAKWYNRLSCAQEVILETIYWFSMPKECQKVKKKKKQFMILQKSYSWKSLYSSHQSKKSSHFICVMNKKTLASSTRIIICLLRKMINLR